jgi:hypothetical protein
MKLVCISDTHNQHKDISYLPDGDMLLHTGDISGIGKGEEVKSFFEWAIKQAPRYTYGIAFIAGNHDRCFDPKFGEYDPEDEYKEGPRRKPKWLVDALHNLKFNNIGVHYLEDSWIKIGDIKIWGSPITPWFHGDRWAFNEHRGPKIAQVWDQMPLDTDIVMTHGPVSYKLDYVPRTQEYVGCEDLRKKIERVKPLLHVSGHIHEGYGVDYNIDTTFVNASICNEYYSPNNKPWEIEVDVRNRTTQIL